LIKGRKHIEMKIKYILVVLILGLLAYSLGSFKKIKATQKQTKAIVLTEGLKLRKKLSNSEKQLFTVALKNGEALLAEVIQESIDVVITIIDPSEQQIQTIDGSEKTERIQLIAKQSGEYKLEVTAFDKEAENGVYNLNVNALLNIEENSNRVAKQEIPSRILYDLWRASKTDKRSIDSFIEKHKEKHLIEPIEGNSSESLVTYFSIPENETEYIMQSGGPDFMGLRFKQLGNTKLQFVSYKVPNTAWFDYGFNEFKLYKNGPNNEIEYRDIKHVYDGTIVMPNAPRDLYGSETNVEKGKLLFTTIKSVFLNEERKITVHTPANYNSNIPHNLLIVFDGEEYGAIKDKIAPVPTPVILDNLIAQNKISPTVSVFVRHMGKRNKDLISDSFADFIAKELLPWSRENYNIGNTSNHVCVAGSSRGGFAASFIAFKHWKHIGNIISQSGSYWITDTEQQNHWIYPTEKGKLINSYSKSPKLPLKFYMDIGLYDSGAAMLGMNREFRSILEIKGYDVDYNEFKGGHGYVNWRRTLADGIIYIFGTGL